MEISQKTRRSKMEKCLRPVVRRVPRAMVGYHTILLFTYTCIICGIAMCHAWDIAPMWLNGEVWEIKRDRALPGMRYAHNDEKTSRIFAKDKIKFGNVKIASTIAEWVEQDEEVEGKHEKEANETEKGGEQSDEAVPNVLGRLICFIYTRGDNGDIDGKEFWKQVQDVKEELSRITNVKMKRVHEAQDKTALKVEAVQWETDQGIVRLSYGVTADKKEKKKRGATNGRPEFIRLTIANDRASMNKGGAQDRVATSKLRNSVKHEEDGTVWIEGIPMVDQGGKGYCVPATLARVFAHYGMSNADMDTLAAVCKTNSVGGTSYAAMEKAMKDIGRRYRLQIKTLYKCWPVPSDAVKEYNAAATKEGKNAIASTRDKEWVRSIDPELWAGIRGKKKNDVSKWFTPIRRQVDCGIPVVWSVYASGFYDRESGRKYAGGPHMRMIIGYNLKQNAIVYSDSWGKWATRRVMTIPEAFSITCGAWLVR